MDTRVLDEAVRFETSRATRKIHTSRLEWWAYVMVALSIFFVCLLLNFVMKKINEVRLNERFLRLQEKASRNRCTQVQEPVPIESSLAEINKERPSSTPLGISFVYNKEDNLNNAHGKSDANPTSESDFESQSKIDVTNSKLNFLGAIYKDLLPSKEVSENIKPIKICDSGNNNIFKEVLDMKGARMLGRES